MISRTRYPVFCFYFFLVFGLLAFLSWLFPCCTRDGHQGEPRCGHARLKPNAERRNEVVHEGTRIVSRSRVVFALVRSALCTHLAVASRPRMLLSSATRASRLAPSLQLEEKKTLISWPPVLCWPVLQSFGVPTHSDGPLAFKALRPTTPEHVCSPVMPRTV